MTSVDISGVTFPVAGMLSRWVQCDQFRKCYRELKGKDCPDVPIVIETYMMKNHVVVLGTECILMGPHAFARGDADMVSFYPLNSVSFCPEDDGDKFWRQ